MDAAPRTDQRSLTQSMLPTADEIAVGRRRLHRKTLPLRPLADGPSLTAALLSHARWLRRMGERPHVEPHRDDVFAG